MPVGRQVTAGCDPRQHVGEDDGCDFLQAGAALRGLRRQKPWTHVELCRSLRVELVLEVQQAAVEGLGAATDVVVQAHTVRLVLQVQALPASLRLGQWTRKVGVKGQLHRRCAG